MNGTANPWSRRATDSCPYSMACACSGPLQRCVQKLFCSREGSQHDWDSHLARSGCLQAKAAALSLLNSGRQLLLGNGEGAPCTGQMRRPGNQVIESPHDPARGSWRHATLRTIRREQCQAWAGSRVAVSQEVGTDRSGRLGLTGPSAKKLS